MNYMTAAIIINSSKQGFQLLGLPIILFTEINNINSYTVLFQFLANRLQHFLVIIDRTEHRAEMKRLDVNKNEWATQSSNYLPSSKNYNPLLLMFVLAMLQSQLRNLYCSHYVYLTPHFKTYTKGNPKIQKKKRYKYALQHDKETAESNSNVQFNTYFLVTKLHRNPISPRLPSKRKGRGNEKTSIWPTKGNSFPI